MSLRKYALVFLALIICGHAGGCIGKETRKEYYDDGKIKASYPFNKKGFIEGVVKTYYPSGTIQSKEAYKNNVKEGTSKAYYESGKLKAEVIFKDDKLSGKFKKYNERGTLLEEGNWEEGKREGIQKVYYESGKVAREGNFNEDKILSETCYDEQGNKVTCPKE
jgi:antitoxin component YwqK of YwqJK toxin-antitoxin module